MIAASHLIAVEALLTPALLWARRRRQSAHRTMAEAEQAEHEASHPIPYLAHHRTKAIAQRIQRANHHAHPWRRLRRWLK